MDRQTHTYSIITHEVNNQSNKLIPGKKRLEKKVMMDSHIISVTFWRLKTVANNMSEGCPCPTSKYGSSEDNKSIKVEVFFNTCP